jgi:RNA polymerase sigma-70 factor, ECF subfamily
LYPAGISSQQLCAFQPAPKRSVQALTSGEEAEFAELVRRQSRFVYRVAYAVLLNRADVEDAVQETFLKLYRNGGWRNAENERAFLARVAWRIAVDRRPRRPDALSFDSNSERAVAHEAPSPDPGPEQALLFADRHARIHAMIDALPEELRLPLILSASDELNSREIGRVLGIPEGTVRTRLQRARELLRSKLDAAGSSRLRNAQVRDPQIGGAKGLDPQAKEAPYV